MVLQSMVESVMNDYARAIVFYVANRDFFNSGIANKGMKSIVLFVDGLWKHQIKGYLEQFV